MCNFERIEILSSIQYGLIGEIQPFIYAVTVLINNQSLQINWYYDNDNDIDIDEIEDNFLGFYAEMCDYLDNNINLNGYKITYNLKKYNNNIEIAGEIVYLKKTNHTILHNFIQLTDYKAIINCNNYFEGYKLCDWSNNNIFYYDHVTGYHYKAEKCILYEKDNLFFAISVRPFIAEQLLIDDNILYSFVKPTLFGGSYEWYIRKQSVLLLFQKILIGKISPSIYRIYVLIKFKTIEVSIYTFDLADYDFSFAWKLILASMYAEFPNSKIKYNIIYYSKDLIDKYKTDIEWTLIYESSL